MPDFSLERAHGGIVCGIDEAGRGSWAGAVVAAAVILNPHEIPKGLDDSKKLSARKRETLFDEIMESAEVGIGMATVAEIDSLNILNASLLAMQRAVEALRIPPTHALVDGNRTPTLRCPASAIVGGDSKCLSIAAASIIAKVTRDRAMVELAKTFPDYGWERNAGYGTQQHQNALATLGVTPHHRLSYRPVRELLEAA